MPPRPTPVPRPPRPRPRADAPTVLYSVEQANRTLPYVRRIAEDLVRDYARWRARVRAIELATTSGTVADETQRRVQRETQTLATDIQAALGELAALGIECKSLEDGLIDFPAVVDGAPAYLCWKPGEPEVAWWHRREAGFAGREPLDGARVEPSIAAAPTASDAAADAPDGASDGSEGAR